MGLTIELSPTRVLPGATHAALLDVALAAIEVVESALAAAEERESPEVSLAYLEASIHALGEVLTRG